MAVLLKASGQQGALAELETDASEFSCATDKDAASTVSSQANLDGLCLRRGAALPGKMLPNNEPEPGSVLVPHWRFGRSVQCTAEVEDDQGRRQTVRGSLKGADFIAQVREVLVL
jgi:hypothetical protein